MLQNQFTPQNKKIYLSQDILSKLSMHWAIGTKIKASIELFPALARMCSQPNCSRILYIRTLCLINCAIYVRIVLLSM